MFLPYRRKPIVKDQVRDRDIIIGHNCNSIEYLPKYEGFFPFSMDEVLLISFFYE